MMIQLKAYLDHDALHVKVHSFKEHRSRLRQPGKPTALLFSNRTRQPKPKKPAPLPKD